MAVTAAVIQNLGRDDGRGHGSGQRSEERFKRDTMNRMRGGAMTLSGT